MASVKLFLLSFIMVGVLVFCNTQALSQQECTGDITGLIRECAQYVQIVGAKTVPSDACCNVLKKVDIPCACSHITKDVEQIISMDKVVYVVKTCGVKLRSGTKCGSYKVPIA